MATIKDVAKLAGVGTSTVSRYFKKGSYISDEAAQKIEQACRVLQYHPSGIARAMKSKQTYTIGLMIPTITNPFFPQLVAIIEKYMMDHGYKTVLCNTNGNITLEKKYMDMAVTSRFDGLIVITGSTHLDRNVTKLPLVMLDRKPANDNVNATVISDNRQGIELAASYLVEKGCQNILYLGSDENLPAKERGDAFVKWMKMHRVKYATAAFDEMSDDEKKSLFKGGYDGVVCWNDIVAIEFLNLARLMQVRIPEDIQVVGYDNIQLAKWTMPSLTTICQPIEEMGKLASEYLLKLIQHEDVPQETVLKNSLVIRKTTKA